VTTRDFERDNVFQQGVRDRILAPAFYGKYALDGRYVFVNQGEMATLSERRGSVDTLARSQRSGEMARIEEKIVRWPGYAYKAFSLETHSCTVPGRESPGWMRYEKADYLLYAFCQEDDDSLMVYLIDFPQLQEWFWAREASFPIFGPLDTLNRSMGRVVEIEAVCAAVKTTKHFVTIRPPAPPAPPPPDYLCVCGARAFYGRPGWPETWFCEAHKPKNAFLRRPVTDNLTASAAVEWRREEGRE
jgi:hypothetical protein